MKYLDNKISVEFDNETGFTKSIINPTDKTKMNWVLENTTWGKVIGFEKYFVQEAEDGIDIISENDSLILNIQKRVKDGKYTENYVIYNKNDKNYTFTKENLGIYYSYNCTFEDKENLHDNTCITHIWCGGDYSWMYSAKPNGDKNYLVCNVTEGSVADYSISYDISNTKCGADYRGDIVLNPGDFTLQANEKISYSFVFYFSDKKPDCKEVNELQKMNLSADKYSAFVGEDIRCEFKSFEGADGLKICCDLKDVRYRMENNTAVFTISFDTPGERSVIAELNGKRLYMRLNVLLPIDRMLINRAEFIVKKQQYHKENSRLDGAYLIYDKDTDSLIYDSEFDNNNASRERISMGVVVAQALQIKYDDKTMASLKKYKEFIEREIYDKSSGRVYSEVGYGKGYKRAYNYPWMSVFYLEQYLLTKDVECLCDSAKIMIAYYELANGGVQESPCIRSFEIIKYLKRESLTELSEKLTRYTLTHAERIIKDGTNCYSEEVSCTQFMFNGKINILCQAYFITGDEKYLEYVEGFIKNSDAFYGRQPDFHLNMLAVRYWDLYWFGKSRTFGDSMPQWLSVLSAETYDFLAEAGFGCIYKEYSRNVVLNNLCVFSPNGFASAGYLVPYKVCQFESDSEKFHYASLKPSLVYGNKYDSYADDQDWAMYYAVKLLITAPCFG